MTSVPEGVCCASCGVWWEPLVFFPFGETFLCVKCERRFQEGYPLYFIFETDVGLDATSKTPTKHEELFRAARVLLRKGISDEDRIVPTLLAADAVDRGIQKWVERKRQGTSGVLYAKREGSQPSHRLQKVGESIHAKVVFDSTLTKPWRLEMVDGVLIVETLPVFVRVMKESVLQIASEVLMQVFPHTRSLSKEEVASLYKDTLSAEGLIGEARGWL